MYTRERRFRVVDRDGYAQPMLVTERVEGRTHLFPQALAITTIANTLACTGLGPLGYMPPGLDPGRRPTAREAMDAMDNDWEAARFAINAVVRFGELPD